MRRLTAALTASVLSAVLTGCGSAADSGELTGLRIMVPNRPGSGYDVTARTVAKALEDARILRDIEVFNLPGADGTVGLQRLVYEHGNSRLLMLMGLGVVGGQYTNESRATLQETTPIARLIQEPGIVVVTRDSPYQALPDLVAAWRRDPRGLSVGGGSAVGGPDHLAAMLIAKAAGIPPRSVNYVRFDGGGELLAGILGRKVVFGVSGVGEYADQIETGQLTVLGVTSERPSPDVAVPTLREMGLDVVFTNWRGIVAPPGLSDADAAQLREAVARLHDSDEWRLALGRNGWTDAFLIGADFGRFVRDESARLGGVLADLGLA